MNLSKLCSRIALAILLSATMSSTWATSWFTGLVATVQVQSDGIVQFALSPALSGSECTTATGGEGRIPYAAPNRAGSLSILLSASLATKQVQVQVSGCDPTGSYFNVQTVKLAGDLSGALPTRTRIFETGTGTYATPAGARQLRIRMKGGGSGGSGTGTSGGTTGDAGNDTSFNSVVAKGAPATTTLTNGLPAKGGTGGAGAASIRIAGASGGWPLFFISTSGSSFAYGGGTGGGTGGGVAANAAIANTGSGGGGGNTVYISGLGTAVQWPSGGGEGEYVELIIDSPAASYAVVVGTGGAGGAAGSNANNPGGSGSNGYIIVDELY